MAKRKKKVGGGGQRHSKGGGRRSTPSPESERAAAPTPQGGLRRRHVLAGLAASALAVAAGAVTWLVRRGDPPAGKLGPVPNADRSADAVPDTDGEIFAAVSHPVLRAVANAIVPPHGAHPGAGDIDLVPHLERCIGYGADDLEFYRHRWPDLEAEIRRVVPFRGGRPEPASLEALLADLYREYRGDVAPSYEAGVFEGLRRNVLLAYYTTPEGWRSVGYPGPVHRTEPLGDGSHG